MENMENIVRLKEIAQSYTILFVEDSKALQKQVVKFLQKLFKEVHVASDGEEGIEKFKEFNPNVVLTDLTMPKLNGHDMIRAIKKIEPDIEIVILSAHSDPDTLMKSFHIGVSDFISKPVNASKMINVFLKVLSTLARNEDKLKAIKNNVQRNDTDTLDFIFINSMDIDIVNHYRGVPLINRGKIVSLENDEIILRTTYLQLLAIKYENMAVLDSSLINEDIKCSLVDINFENYEVTFKKEELFQSTYKNREEIRVEPADDLRAFMEIEGQREAVEVIDISTKAVLFSHPNIKEEFKRNDTFKLIIVFDNLKKITTENTSKAIETDVSVYKTVRKKEKDFLVVFFKDFKINSILHKYIFNREVELVEEFKSKFQET